MNETATIGGATRELMNGAEGMVDAGVDAGEARKLALALQEEQSFYRAPVTLGISNSKERWNCYAEVPARLSVQLPLPRLSLNDLLTLKPGTMLVSEWHVSQDVSLLVGDVFLANVSCEPAGERLGVRINGFDQPTHGV